MRTLVLRSRFSRKVLVDRHSAVVRVTHWINAACFALLLLSGLQIFNAHPSLYWGQSGANGDPPVISIETVDDGESVAGVTHIGPLAIGTTGVLGASADEDGELDGRAFPSWLTVPSYQDLSTGRRWHFFFAWAFVLNGLAYIVYGALSGHVVRDLAPDRDQLHPRHLLHAIGEHARLHFPKGEEARRYNVLQKIAYLLVIFVLLPCMIASGLTMSPGVDAAWPLLLDLFGGRQSARTIHFVTAFLLVSFVIVHLAMVIAAGPWNAMRSMITGRFSIDPEEPRP